MSISLHIYLLLFHVRDGAGQEGGAAGTNQEHSNHLSAVPAIMMIMVMVIIMIMMTMILMSTLMTNMAYSNHLPATVVHISALQSNLCAAHRGE